MVLKSKGFWIWTVLGVCTVIFLGGVLHQAKQPQEVITVYKVVDPLPRETHRFSADATASGQISHETAAEIDTLDTTFSDFSEGSEIDMTEVFTYTSDDFFADEQHFSEAADVQPDDFNADAQAEDASTAQQLEKLHIEIPQKLQERLDLLDLIEELDDLSNDEEARLIRQQAREKTEELMRTIFDLAAHYLLYSKGDISAFRPGGEFYDLMEQNRMGMEEADSW